jgi:peptidoglycan-N-acetylglucosamine deacetylase
MKSTPDNFEARLPARRWRPAPLLKISLALHVAGLLAFAFNPTAWMWIVAVLAGNHLVVITSVFCPRGRLLGPNVVRLPAAAAARGEVALTFDDGPDPDVTPRVLDLLDRFEMKASFFCIGSKVRAHPDIVHDIIARGHTVENHSFDHPHAFAMIGPKRASRDIDAAQAAIERASGCHPRYFRAPNGFRNPWLDPVLARRNLRYVSWTRRGLDTVRHDAAAVTRALTRDLKAGDILLLHDGNCGRASDGCAMVLTVLPTLLERLHCAGLKSVALRSALEPH